MTLKNGEPSSADRFFVLPWRKLRSIVVRGYRRYLAKHGNVRSRSRESFHTKVDISDVVAFEQRWELICGRARSIQYSKINRWLSVSFPQLVMKKGPEHRASFRSGAKGGTQP